MCVNRHDMVIELISSVVVETSLKVESYWDLKEFAIC
jgi:hypothetical protein